MRIPCRRTNHQILNCFWNSSKCSTSMASQHRKQIFLHDQIRIDRLRRPLESLYQGLFKVIARPSERVFTIDMRRKHINANDSYLECIDRRWDRIPRNYVCNSNDYLKLRVRIPIIEVFGVHVGRDFGSLEFSHECNQFEYGSSGVYVAISKSIATNIQYRLKPSRLPAQSSWFKREWKERKITIVGWIRHYHHEMI